MADSPSRVTLATLASGAAEEMFQHELAAALRNISDPNTDPAKAREITLKVKLRPYPDRAGASVAVDVSSKLAPVKPTTSTMFIGEEGGQFFAVARDLRQFEIPLEAAQAPQQTPASEPGVVPMPFIPRTANQA